MIKDIIFLSGGLFLLFEGGNYLVKSSVDLAKHFKVSNFLIAVVIISFGTSFPELIVSINAALQNHPDISMGNVVGSNIANIALGIGIAALIFPIVVRKKEIYLDWIILFSASILLIILIYDGILSRVDGIIFIVLFILYLVLSVKKDKNNPELHEVETIKPKFGKLVAFLIAVISIIALWFGSEGIIEGGSNIAKALGISERIISLTVIALGTSLPEITTSVFAFHDNKPEITLGNIIGSNIFNILLILGTTSIINPINVNPRINNLDVWWMILMVLFLLPVINIIKHRTPVRIYAAIILIFYAYYISILFL